VASTLSYPMTVRIPDAVRLTGISRSTLYVLIRDQRIETVKVGRSRYIVVASLQRFIDANRM
jgi:excisionase family DNA binding protein